MGSADISAFTGNEIKVYLRYNNYDLLEINEVTYSVDRKGRVGGAGLGHCKNRYHKTGVPEGTFTIGKNWLNNGDQADLFASLFSGVTQVTTEAFSSGASSLTTASNLVGLLSVVVTGGDPDQILNEGADYTVSYGASDTITFIGGAPGDGRVVYLSDADNTDDNPLDGTNFSFQFDLEWRDRDTNAVKIRLRGCQIYTFDVSSAEGEESFTEDVSGMFLDLDRNP